MNTVYILYSSTLKKYYTGQTEGSMMERLRRHNSAHKGFTGKVNDWVIVYTVEKGDKSEALSLEQKIKSRGAERFLKDLGEKDG